MKKYEITLLFTSKSENKMCQFKTYEIYANSKAEAIHHANVKAWQEISDDYELSYWYKIKKQED